MRVRAGSRCPRSQRAIENAVQRAFTLRGRIRILDGLYVALAEDLRCPLVTTDIRLCRANAPCEVQAPPQR